MAKKKKGFFDTSAEAVVASPTKPNCGECRLQEVCTSPKMRVYGDGRLNVLIVSQSPSLQEDNKGCYGYGKEFAFLEKTLEDMGYDMQKDFWYTTAVGCKTPRNRLPSKAEIEYCHPKLEKTIAMLDPRVIILLGKSAFDAIIQPQITGRLTGTSFNKFYGSTIPSQEMGRWLCPTYEPSEMLTTRVYEDSGWESKPLYQRDIAIYRLWTQHLQAAIDLAPTPVKIVDYKSMCKTTQDIDVAIEWISEASEWKYVAWDVETTGLKAHKKGHRIVSVSISNGKASYAFPFFNDAFFHKIWKRFMLSPVKKIAHNFSYELQWIRELEGYWCSEVYWDTMLSMHIVNNNSPTGLKFVNYITTGVVGYDDSCDKFLKASTKDEELYGNNAFNNIQNAPMEETLLYNAEDSLFTFIIYEDHVSRIGPFQMQGMKFLMESMVTLAKTSANGFRLDTDQLVVVTKELEEKIELAKKDIMNSEEVSLWDDPDKVFNFDSSPQLGHLLYDILKLKPPFLTEGGKPSVDAEALEKLKCPLVEKILRQRKLKKLLGTYINQYGVEVVDGFIHPQFYLNSVVSYRSSCGNVNVQNLPKRDKEAKRMITSLVLPHEGQQLIGMDYKGIEVVTNACYSMDKNLLAYVQDETLDFHRDSAMDIFMLEKEQVTKSIRSKTKGYVFACFFGSYYKLTAPDMWIVAQEEGLIEHLKSKGIDTFAKFEARVQKADDIMWNERFPQHAAWRRERWNTYQKKGYLDSYDGYRFYGPMSRNLSFNLGGQCSAYHVLQRTMNKMQAYIEEHNLKSKLIFQIHDALYYSAEPSEVEELKYWSWWYGTQEVREAWPWIAVPLQIEMETGPVGCNWAELKEVGYLTGK